MAFLLQTLIYETDLQFNFLFINQATLNVLEISEQDYQKKSLLSFLNEDGQKRVVEYCQDISSTGILPFMELKVCINTDKTTAILAKASPIINSDRIEGFRWSAIDIKPMIGEIINPEDNFFQQFKLSPRETEVLKLLLEGNKNRMISKKLYIAESTVKDHLGSVYSKMKVKNKQDLFMFLEESQKNKFGPESFLFCVISKLIKD